MAKKGEPVAGERRAPEMEPPSMGICPACGEGMHGRAHKGCWDRMTAYLKQHGFAIVRLASSPPASSPGGVEREKPLIDQVLAQLRHAYQQLVGGHLGNHKAFADGLIKPQIIKLEKLQSALHADAARPRAFPADDLIAEIQDWICPNSETCGHGCELLKRVLVELRAEKK